MTKTAKFVREIVSKRAVQRIYRVDPPVAFADDPSRSSRYVLVSATVVPITGPETLAFPCDKDGYVLSWIDVFGRCGTLSHEQVLREAGYAL